MELKVSSQKLDHSPSVSASYPEEKEISEGEDEDDDRNHKHRKRETRSQSLEEDSFDQELKRPYRKRKKPFENGYNFRPVDPQSGQNWKNSNIALGRDFSSRFEKRRSNQTSLSKAPFDLSQRIRGNQLQSGEAGLTRGSRGEPVAWSLNDSRNGLVDFASQMVQPGPVPSGLLAGRGLPDISSVQGTSWNAFGFVPGLPNGGFDALHPLAMQGALRPSISPSMNMGIPRQQCRDFEERGFCLRGDMCPMEHGLNRIVVEDVQSLSQFNLPGTQLPGTSSAFPVISTSSGSLANSKAIHTKNSKYGMTEYGLGLNGSLPGGSVVGGSDVYDPDQPLWTNDNPETSAALLALNQLSADETESLPRKDPDDLQSIGLDEEHPIGSGAAAGAQSVSVWRRISSSKNSLGQKDKLNSVGTSSSYRELDIKSEEEASTGLQDVSYQRKQMNVDESGSKVKEASDKPYIRNQSNKALRTLFVNGIPLKNNTRESLLSHFQKFGKVIDIYIPKHSERAFVQFSKREEAEAALKAPDAVMGNRFIKLWWANRDNIPDDGISGPGSVQITQGFTLGPARSHQFIPGKGKENPNPAAAKNVTAAVAQVPVYDNPKPLAVSGSNTLHVQKKQESLELLKEELRKKQQMLDQKRNEFRRQLNKLEKQASGSKDIAASDHADKRLRGDAPTHQTSAETSKSPPRANIVAESSKYAESSMTHTSTANPTGPVQEPSSLRPLIRPQAPPWAPFSANRFKLDNRPTAFRIVSPLPAGLANVATLKEHFSTFGDLSSVQLEEPEHQDTNDASATPSVSACISFTTRRSAEKAFLHGKCWEGHNLQFMWVTPNSSVKRSNPPGASDTPSDANATPTEEAKRTTASGNDEPENPIGQSDAASVSQEEDSA
ncbi:hypothetical protein CDL12_17295 [Handroanthus impetiginosus]|uniref:Uncharacterized protein n=1 Tax=Handroanthus impetiginosus TaxID=429701 RepID=A0A2G9GXX3_9LAMI|nr:hypothetical protein CDL12_17295 [Handroanthus impetiginosus]